LVSVLTCALTPILASAAWIASCVAGFLKVTVTSVPPVNERPSRSGAPVWT
jgi:hypothetical protein